MTTVIVKIDPVFCGPASIGTVELIKLVRLSCGLSLADAHQIVNRGVFEGEPIRLEFASLEAANDFATKARNSSSIAVITAEIEPTSH